MGASPVHTCMLLMPLGVGPADGQGPGPEASAANLFASAGLQWDMGCAGTAPAQQSSVLAITALLEQLGMELLLPK